MNPKELDKLVEKFYAGETTAEEEAQLKDFLQAGNIPGHLAHVRHYFDVMDSLREEELGNDFETRLFERISEREHKPRVRRLASRFAYAAAAVLLLLAVWKGPGLLQPKPVYGTVDDPVIAFQETKEALNKVSVKMNDGLKPAKKTVTSVEENIQKAGEMKKLNEALNKTKNINKLDKASEFLKSFNKVYVNYGNS